MRIRVLVYKRKILFNALETCEIFFNSEFIFKWKNKQYWNRDVEKKRKGNLITTTKPISYICT